MLGKEVKVNEFDLKKYKESFNVDLNNLINEFITSLVITTNEGYHLFESDYTDFALKLEGLQGKELLKIYPSRDKIHLECKYFSELYDKDLSLEYIILNIFYKLLDKHRLVSLDNFIKLVSATKRNNLNYDKMDNLLKYRFSNLIDYSNKEFINIVPKDRVSHRLLKYLDSNSVELSSNSNNYLSTKDFLVKSRNITSENIITLYLGNKNYFLYSSDDSFYLLESREDGVSVSEYSSFDESFKILSERFDLDLINGIELLKKQNNYISTNLKGLLLEV